MPVTERRCHLNRTCRRPAPPAARPWPGSAGKPPGSAHQTRLPNSRSCSGQVRDRAEAPGVWLRAVPRWSPTPRQARQGCSPRLLTIRRGQHPERRRTASAGRSTASCADPHQSDDEVTGLRPEYSTGSLTIRRLPQVMHISSGLCWSSAEIQVARKQWSTGMRWRWSALGHQRPVR